MKSEFDRLHERLDVQDERLFGLAQDVAAIKARTERKRIPDSVWKGVGAILLALATVIGGYAGLSGAKAQTPETEAK